MYKRQNKNSWHFYVTSIVNRTCYGNQLQSLNSFFLRIHQRIGESLVPALKEIHPLDQWTSLCKLPPCILCPWTEYLPFFRCVPKNFQLLHVFIVESFSSRVAFNRSQKSHFQTLYPTHISHKLKDKSIYFYFRKMPFL